LYFIILYNKDESMSKIINCPNCRKEINENSNFCSFCGSKIEKNEQKTVTVFLDMKIKGKQLLISNTVIRYDNKEIRTREVDRVRWGIYKNYVNAVPVERKYTIWVGTSENTITPDGHFKIPHLWPGQNPPPLVGRTSVI